MLKPFQIRNLRGSSSSGDLEDTSSQPSNLHGVVRVSAADYDDIALVHPRARLTYLDEDDGDQITVGSSLELSQRLDEPLDVDTSLDNVQPSPDELVTMHNFDIRRTNSVIELWKQFERDNDAIRSQQMVTEAAVETEATSDEHKHNEGPTSHDAAVTSAPEAENQPFMAAFEAELSSLLNSAETPGQRATQPEVSSAAEPSTSGASSQRAHHPLEVVAATFLYHLVNGANSVQSELRSRLPELQEQLRNAQRTVPENVRSSLHSLLATIEAHMRTAFQNLPDNGRQFAEDAINAGRPVAEHAADGIRMMAAELNEASRTLFAAFENEFGLSASTESNATSTAPHAAPGPFPTATADVHVPDSTSGDAHAHPTDSGVEKESTADTHPFAQSPEANSHTLPSDFTSPAWDIIREEPYRFHPPGPHGHPPPFPPRPPHHHVPPMPPRHWPPIPRHHPRAPSHPPWHMPWDPVPSLGHHPPPPPPQLPLASGMFPAPSWLPTNTWFNPASPHSPHSSPPAPPPNEASRCSTEPSETPERKVLFIGNVGFNVTEKMIQDVFASKGFIVSVRLPQDSDTCQHAGFGYVDFPSIHPAMAAMDALQGVHIDGHAINLEFSDDAVIDSVHPTQRPSYAEPRTLYETFARQNQLESGHFGVSSSDQTGSDVSVGQRARPHRASRRKSVAFQEPDMSSLDPQNKDVPSRLQSPPLIDLTTDDAAANYQANDVQDQLPEMSRFPPVSQLEAQLFANQQQSRALEVTSDATAHRAAYESNPSLPVYDAHGEEPSPLDEGNRRDKSGVVRGPGLRRSNTMTFSRQGGELSDFPNWVQGNPSDRNPLRRRASERPSLRREVHDPRETDTWARLDRRERRRSRPSSYQSIPGSFPVEEVSQPTASGPAEVSETGETDIDKCVSSLVDMGYGSPEDGGRSRMAVYAAASNCDLFDAIEMIEEERKAYARQG